MMNTHFFLLYLLCLFALAGGSRAAANKVEGVREQWGETYLFLREPVVSQTVVENARRAAGWDEEDGSGKPARPKPTPAECGADLFTVSGKPAPRLCWNDQDRLRIEFAPGSSARTEFRIDFRPGTTYLSGKPMEQTSFRFHRKPACPTADLLGNHAGGAALISAAHEDSLEARELHRRHAGLSVRFRRMRHIPLVGWTCTGTVEARLRPATVADGITRGSILEALMEGREPGGISSASPLPRTLLALPVEPLVPGASYEVEVEAAPGSGFQSCIGERHELPEGLDCELERDFVAMDATSGKPAHTRLRLHFSQPVPEAALRELWSKLELAVDGQPCRFGPEAAYHADAGGKALAFKLRGLLPCREQAMSWSSGTRCSYAPAGCGQGLDIEVEGDACAELRLTVPAGLQGLHGLAMAEARELGASLSPACAAMTGDGSNLIPWSGEHRLRLPLINVSRVHARAYRWEAEDAARLLPLIRSSMRDDTHACELLRQLDWLKRRAAEGLDTDMNGRDGRTTAGRAIAKLNREVKGMGPLRALTLSQATAYPSQQLEIKPQPGGNALEQRGEAILDMDALTRGALKPGLYLVTLTTHPGETVVRALEAFEPEHARRSCTVDYLVQVTDLGLRCGGNRLLVRSLATGETLDGIDIRPYQLPPASSEEDDIPTAEATPLPLPAPLTLRRGDIALPAASVPADSLLLLRRGEDYRLYSLAGNLREPQDAGRAAAPLAELYCDRPLYRPGETAHLRGVLRLPQGDSLALPRCKTAKLTIRKPNGDLMQTLEPRLDAYGAFSADIALPAGEEDVTGGYECRLEAQEAEAALTLHCEVFRRDAFEAGLTAELEPVAADSYRLIVEARDYNGTSIAQGKLRLELHSDIGLLDSEGKAPQGLKKEDGHESWVQELALDAQGRAEVRGKFAPYDSYGSFTIGGSVANDRAEYVKLKESVQKLSPVDFRMQVEWRDGGHRLMLRDARTGKPLDREQELELRVLCEQEQRESWPCGISRESHRPIEQGRCRITVPAHCDAGLPLGDYLKGAASRMASCNIELRGRDTAGREVCWKQHLNPYGYGGSNAGLQAEGNELVFRPSSPFAHKGQLQLYIASQGRLRYELLPVEAGEKEVRIPLTAREYGEVALTAVSCGADDWGTCTRWKEENARCERPRPDKQLKVEFTLPEGAKPGEAHRIAGRVLDAAGKPARASVNLFAVDAGMMSVAPYRLPELATRFYRGRATAFHLSYQENRRACQPRLLALPNVWSMAGADWDDGQRAARLRSVCPEGLDIPMRRDSLGALCRGDMEDIVRRVLGRNFANMKSTSEAPAAPCIAAAPVKMECSAAEVDVDQLPTWMLEEEGVAEDVVANGLLTKGLRSGSGALMGDTLVRLVGKEPARPRLRANFAPVALWQGSIDTAEDGSFSCPLTLPDTLTTYRVYAVVLGKDGGSFGTGESEFLVNQKLMLTAGTPFFMSLGDKLMLPLTITNNSEEAGRWSVELDGAGNVPAQQVELAAQETKTLHFPVSATEEGERTLTWTATGGADGDAVSASFPVLYPAPLLKEHHRLVLEAGETLASADLLAAELADSTRGGISLEYATSPLLHLSGSWDYLLNYPYGCTEQSAGALLPWLYHRQLAPYCPQMARSSEAEAQDNIKRGIAALIARQQKDGGLSYWGSSADEWHPSSPWASAYAGLVLTIAQELGHEVPGKALSNLRHYLGQQDWKHTGALVQYAAARTQGESGKANRILVRALKDELKAEDIGCRWHSKRGTVADLRFMAELRSNPAGRHDALLNWMRSQGRDHRHPSTWSSGWQLIALGEYLKHETQAGQDGALAVNGESRTATAAPARLEWNAAPTLRAAAPKLAAQQGRVYVTLKAKARPERTDYPGVTEKGLQITRIYETQDTEGQWHETTQWKVGDIVRVTLTCAKAADELEYLVLEDRLPACLEAINPRVPGQAAGIENGGLGMWSSFIDHKEYLADRVRAFSTRWPGRELLNMRYYARVKRAGECTAPPAEAQLMYEPQIYGLSPNSRVVAEP